MSFSNRCIKIYATVVLFCSTVTALDSSIFEVNNPAFNKLLGKHPSIERQTKADKPLYHESGAYHAATQSLWVTSDMIPAADNTTERYIFRITGLESPDTIDIERINNTIPNAVGGAVTTANSPLGDVILFVAQGTLEKSPPGGVYAMNPYPPHNTSLVLGSYGDYPFNSLDEIAVTPDGMIWISDPPYGYEEGNRNLPTLPNQVYSYNPSTKETRVVADGFGRPNGLAYSPGGKKIYIGDTGASVGNGTLDLQGPRTIYGFDRSGSFLTNRHVFAMPQTFGSAPDGMRTDTLGNLWAAVPGVGVSVWNSDGVLLGSIKLQGDMGNLGFGKPGQLFVLGGDCIFKLRLSEKVVGAEP